MLPLDCVQLKDWHLLDSANHIQFEDACLISIGNEWYPSTQPYEGTKEGQHATARGGHCHELTHIIALLVLSFSYAECLQVSHVLGFKLHNPLLCDLIEWKSFPLVMERFRALQKMQMLLILCNMLFPWGEYWDFNGKIILTQNLILFDFYIALSY